MINYFFEDVKNCKHQLPSKKWIKQCLEKEEHEVTYKILFSALTITKAH